MRSPAIANAATAGQHPGRRRPVGLPRLRAVLAEGMKKSGDLLG